MPRTHSSLSVSIARLNQLRAIAKHEGVSVSAILDEFIARKWARHAAAASVGTLDGFQIDERFDAASEEERPLVLFFEDTLGGVVLSPSDALALARGLNRMLHGKQSFCSVFDCVSRDGGMLVVQARGREFVFSVVKAQAEGQSQRSRTVGRKLLARVSVAAMTASERALRIYG